MTYQVIARKWRPRKFGELVGQEHIATTLKNAVMLNRIAHAYLFVGPRGIGKTTTARIFAKALNCANPDHGEPCCACPSCVSIADGSNIDVIEIDAASQNSVQNIRDLREEVMFTPVNAKFKVYIIDEVHMLSQGAWNALLKTVEEPPPHVKFLFATTEAHKVLPTIISRCQRFDLRRIPTPLIADRLAFIAESENVLISRSAIGAIARAADGGMRDGQSLLDQMISFYGTDGSEEISEEQVLSLFGLTAMSDMEKLVDAILANRGGDVVRHLHELSSQGKNLEKLFEDILSWLRGSQLCQLIDDPETIMETGRESVERFKKLGSKVSPFVTQTLLETLAPVGRSLRDALNKQVFLEMILLKAMRTSHAARVEDVLRRLNQIRTSGELKILDDPRLAPHSPQTSKPITPALSAQIPQPRQPSSQETPRPAQPSDSIRKTKNSMGEPIKIVPPVAVSSQDSKAKVTQKERITPSPEAIAPASSPSGKHVFKAKPGTPDSAGTPSPSRASERQDSHSDSLPPSAPEPRQPPPPTQTRTPQYMWHLLMEDIENHQGNPILKGMMMEGVPQRYENSMLTILFDEEYDLKHAREVRSHLELLNNCFRRISSDRKAELNIEIKAGVSSPKDRDDPRDEDLTELKTRMKNNAFVKKVINLFEGEIVDVHG